MLRNQTRLFRPIAPVGSATTFRIGLHRALAAMVSVAFLASGMTVAQAADYYWDANGVGAGTGGSGTWTTTNTWRTGSATGTLVSWPGATNNAFMEGTAGVLTLSSSVTMGASGTAFFNVTNYTLAPEATTTRQLLGTVVVGSGLNLNINNTGSTGNQTIGFFGNVTGGTLTLQGAPSSGNASRINISSGTLSSAVTINTTGVGNAGIVGLSTGAVVSGAIINSSTGNRTMIGATSGNDITLTSSAIISGSTGLQFAAGSSGGTGTVTLNSQSTYTGITEFNAGNNAVVRLGVNNALPTTTDVSWATSNGNGGILDLNGFNQEFASLAKAATTGTGSIRNNGGGTSVLKIGGATTGTAAFSIPIVDNTSGTGTVSIERAGTGSLTLSASNSYSGPTTVTNGTLIAGNAFAFGTASGNLVAAGGVLDLGTFSIARTGTVSFTGGTVQTGTLTNNVVAYDGQAGRVSATLAGSAGLTKTTSGTLILGSANSYTGPTTLSAGTLRGGHNSAFGSGTLGLNGGTLTSGTDNAARTFANNVTVGGDVAFGDATATGGLAFSGTVDLGNAARTLTTVQTSTFSGPISNGGLIKSGTALLTLSSSNTYSAGTTVSAGTLKAGNVNAFGSGSMTLSASSTLDLNSLAIANNITNNGGTLANAASYSGTQSLTAAASFGALGGTLSVINGGSATLTGAVTGTMSIAAGGGATLGDGGSLSQASLSNAGTFTVNKSGSTTLSTALTGSGAFQKLGSGMLTVTGSSTSTGATTVSTGTLKAGNANAFGTGTMTLSAGATLDLNSLSVANNITHNGGTLANAASYTGTQSLTAAASFGDLGGTLSVINGGSATLTGAVTGTMSIAAGGGATLGNGGSLSQASLSNAGTFIVNKSVDSSLSTAISGAGGFQKLGSGILTVTGNNTYTGATTVSAGGLKVNGVLGSGSLSVAASAWLMGTGTINGPVTISGTLTPGASPGVITLASLVLTPTSSTVIEIASAGTRGTAYDGVSILDAGGLTYGGTMSIVFGSSAIADNTTFDVFSFTGSSTGSLAAIESSGYYTGTWTPLGSGTYQLLSGSQTLTFSQSSGDVIVVPEPTVIALAAAGLGAMAYAVRRRYRQA